MSHAMRESVSMIASTWRGVAVNACTYSGDRDCTSNQQCTPLIGRFLYDRLADTGGHLRGCECRTIESRAYVCASCSLLHRLSRTWLNQLMYSRTPGALALSPVAHSCFSSSLGSMVVNNSCSRSVNCSASSAGEAREFCRNMGVALTSPMTWIGFERNCCRHNIMSAMQYARERERERERGILLACQ